MQTKQLVLIRHAQAVEATEFDGADFDRPLTDKGEESAYIIARYLRISGVYPDFVLSSSSVRTRQTAEIICKQYGMETFELSEELYNGLDTKRGSRKIYTSAIAGINSDVNTLFVVAHNDELTEFAKYLSDDGVPYMKKGSALILALPEGADWKDITEGELEVLYYLTPQFLRLELSCIHDR